MTSTQKPAFRKKIGTNHEYNSWRYIDVVQTISLNKPIEVTSLNSTEKLLSLTHSRSSLTFKRTTVADINIIFLCIGRNYYAAKQGI
jgi:hypothetical protein